MPQNGITGLFSLGVQAAVAWLEDEGPWRRQAPASLSWLPLESTQPGAQQLLHLAASFSTVVPLGARSHGPPEQGLVCIHTYLAKQILAHLGIV